MEGFNKGRLVLVVAVLGVSHVLTQITVMREFINIYAGNEIVFGVLLALWLLITGLGARLGAVVARPESRRAMLRAGLIAAAVLPLLNIVVIRWSRDILFIRGELPGVGSLVVWGTAVLLPYCTITGMLLTIACAMYPSREETRDSVGRVYLFDTLGDVLGGLLFTCVLVSSFSNYDLLYLPALLCLGGFFLTGSGQRSRAATAVGVLVSAAVAAVMAFVPLDTISLRWLYPFQTIIDYAETPYGRLVVTRDRDEVTFFENGELLFSTPDVLAGEELVHFALPQRDMVRSVLLVSGGVAGTIGEILKYGVTRLDYVEIDPAIIELARRHLEVSFPPAVRIFLDDGRAFIRQAHSSYDAVILDLPDPVSLQLNRFYTLELFREIKAILNPGGVVCFGIGGAENYISLDEAYLFSTLEKTLRDVFPSVLMIPGEHVIFVASEGTLITDVAPLIAAKGIKTVYVNQHYLRSRVTDERVAHLRGSLMDDVPLNSDFHPVAYRYAMKVWLGMFRERYMIPVLIALAFTCIYFLRLGVVEKTIFTTGIVASSMELIMLLSYQILHGSVYTGIGFILASFMAGLAAGSGAAMRLRDIHLSTLMKVEGAIIIFILASAGALLFWREFLSPSVIALMTGLIAALTGAEFPLAATLARGEAARTAGSLYAADFIGGGVGAFVTGLVLIPAIGVAFTCFMLAALKVLILAGLAVTIRMHVT